MDPVTNLERQRELAKDIAALNGSVSVHETGKPTRSLWHYAEELAELMLALDEWRRNGGYDPYLPVAATDVCHDQFNMHSASIRCPLCEVER